MELVGSLEPRWVNEFARIVGHASLMSMRVIVGGLV
jgi:hypothetical protein